MATTVEYAPGRLIDIHGDGDRGIVLLWHGRGPNERAALAPLATAIASRGVRALAADWDSTADDAGRSDLLASLDHARRAATSIGIDPRRLVVAGWSLGATAAIGLATSRDGPECTILLAPGDGARAVEPLGGAPLPEVFPGSKGRARFDVFHGARDDISDPTLVRGLVARLRSAGWQTTITEVDTDHVGIVGMAYDLAGRLRAETDDPAVHVAVDRITAAVVAAAVSPS